MSTDDIGHDLRCLFHRGLNRVLNVVTVLGAVKPVHEASELSKSCIIAKLLATGFLEFDLVIFDRDHLWRSITRYVRRRSVGKSAR